jgi:hypothetical protein
MLSDLQDNVQPNSTASHDLNDDHEPKQETTADSHQCDELAEPGESYEVPQNFVDWARSQPDDPEEEVPWLDDSGDLSPEKGVLDWSITAVGSRPEDFLARDLMLASLLRNPKPRGFHYRCMEPDYWAEHTVSRLPPRHQQQVRQHLALHYCHRRQLASLLPEAISSGQQGDPVQYDLLRRLWRCWPYGVQVQWTGDGERTNQDVCELAWLCPWCFARRVSRLYKQLHTALSGSSDRTHLVLCRIHVSAQAVPLNQEMVQDGLSSFGYLCKTGGLPWFVQGLGVNFRRRLTPCQVDYVRDELGGKLRQWASNHGIRGGILVLKQARFSCPDGKFA